MVEPIDIRDFKKKWENKLIAELADVIVKCSEIDKDAYATAAEQAKLIESALQDPDVHAITLIIGGNTYRLDVMHTDVLNIVYLMLESLQDLGGELDGRD